MARSTAPKKAPRRVTQDYLDMCWEKRPLEPTEGFGGLLGVLQTITTAALAGDLPSRAELAGMLQGTLEHDVFTPDFFQTVGKWMVENCTSQAQQENIRFTLREMTEQAWLPEYPPIAFLFTLWEPEWGKFVSELFIPGGHWILPEVVDQQEGPTYFDGILSWWLLSSHIRAWHRAPEHFYRQLCQRALEDFGDDFPEVSLAQVLAADEILAELISEEAYRNYLYDPSELDWMRQAAEAWEKRGQDVTTLRADIEEYASELEDEQ
ncbi:MAG: hypothetical protein KF760_26485 [Candidatus Eremiobacteraeota bacterium]|nr:hypothetical protein [Candidatus Eremiobacteraeota bacterium]MCW5870537.1 hypothetical protein [Candidatus Eremiobacteraeota bacterium]